MLRRGAYGRWRALHGIRSFCCRVLRVVAHRRVSAVAFPLGHTIALRVLCGGVCWAPPRAAAACAGCGKSVYAMDKQVSAEGQVYHLSCFKCSHCKSQLSLVTWAQASGVIYCKAHFKELFMCTCVGGR